MIGLESLRVAIVGGYGGMGSLMAREFIASGHEVVIAGPNARKGEEVAGELGAVYDQDNAKAVSSADMVIVTVPMEATPGVIAEVAPHVKKGALLADLTSVKQEPCRLMAEKSGEGVEVVGCHPVFGPSVSSITGQVFILCPVRGSKWFDWFKVFLEGKKARVYEATPAEHDHMMAVIQGLTHFGYISFGKSLASLGFDVKASRSFSSPVYDMMLDMVGRILGQNPHLYAEIQMENPDIPGVHDAFLATAKELSDIVRAKDHDAFVDYMRQAAIAFGDTEQAMARSDKAIASLMAELEALKAAVGEELCLEHLYSKSRHFGRLVDVSPDEVVLEANGKRRTLKSSNLRVLWGDEEKAFLADKFGVVIRDYSFLFREAVDEKLLATLAMRHLDVHSCEVKDVYTGTGVSDDEKSICFSVSFLNRDVRDRDAEIASFFDKLGGTRR